MWKKECTHWKKNNRHGYTRWTILDSTTVILFLKFKYKCEFLSASGERDGPHL